MKISTLLHSPLLNYTYLFKNYSFPNIIRQHTAYVVFTHSLDLQTELGLQYHLGACAQLLQSHLTFCNSMDCSPPGSSVCGILQARILERAAMPPSRGSSRPGITPASLMLSALAGGFFTTSAT